VKVSATAAAVSVRPMRPEDIAAVYAIEQRIFPIPWPLSSYHFEIQNPVAHKWVAEIENEIGEAVIAGMIIVWLLVDEAHIGNIGVDRPFRRRGIGCRLLQTALLDLVRLGAVKATLEVRESNQSARGLYHRFGFIPAGRRKAYYIDNREDALILSLSSLEASGLGAIECEGA